MRLSPSQARKRLATSSPSCSRTASAASPRRPWTSISGSERTGRVPGAGGGREGASGGGRGGRLGRLRPQLEAHERPAGEVPERGDVALAEPGGRENEVGAHQPVGAELAGRRLGAADDAHG